MPRSKNTYIIRRIIRHETYNEVYIRRSHNYCKWQPRMIDLVIYDCVEKWHESKFRCTLKQVFVRKGYL